MHSTLCKKCFGCWVCKTNASVNFSTFAAIGLILQTVVTGHFKLDGILIFPVQSAQGGRLCMSSAKFDKKCTCLAVGTSLARPACWLMLWKPPKWKKWVSKYILQPANQQFHQQATQQFENSFYKKMLQKFCKNPGLKRVTLNWSSWFVPQFGHLWDPRSLAQLHVQQAFLRRKVRRFHGDFRIFAWGNFPIFLGRVKGWERKNTTFNFSWGLNKKMMGFS